MPNPILQMLSGDFNPRSPCGERPWVSVLYSEAGVFQSTLPVRGATTAVRDTPTIPAFQSTLPVRGATTNAGGWNNCQMHFNPRSPCGERLGAIILIPVGTEISIHAPRAGSDWCCRGALH